MKKKVEEILIELGIYPNLTGFNYICRAVEIISESKEKIKIFDGLYANISKEYNTTISGVERAIRHAIEKMDKDSEAFKKYIGIKDVTNSAVLYTLAVRLKED